MGFETHNPAFGRNPLARYAAACHPTAQPERAIGWWTIGLVKFNLHGTQKRSTISVAADPESRRGTGIDAHQTRVLLSAHALCSERRRRQERRSHSGLLRRMAP